MARTDGNNRFSAEATQRNTHNSTYPFLTTSKLHLDVVVILSAFPRNRCRTHGTYPLGLCCCRGRFLPPFDSRLGPDAGSLLVQLLNVVHLTILPDLVIPFSVAGVIIRMAWRRLGLLHHTRTKMTVSRSSSRAGGGHRHEVSYEEMWCLTKYKQVRKTDLLSQVLNDVDGIGHAILPAPLRPIEFDKVCRRHVLLLPQNCISPSSQVLGAEGRFWVVGLPQDTRQLACKQQPRDGQTRSTSFQVQINRRF